MKGINIFISDKIRIHPLEFTADGLGMARSPYLLLPLHITDEDLSKALHEAMNQSKSGVPYRVLTKAEEKAYHQALGVKSYKELGHGLDIILENSRYTITPFDKRGLFGQPMEVEEQDLLETIREYLGLVPAKVE